MPIIQQGSTNLSALNVPDLYVQIVPPQSYVVNGVQTDILGIVGTATWGPVGKPVIGGPTDYAGAFGAIMPRKYDMGTHTAIAAQNGAVNFRWVRVTDGTDTVASAEFLGSLTLSALYSGSLGNSLYAIFGPGSAAGTMRITIGLPGATPEVYDNIPGTGATLWQNAAAAINLGTNNGLRGPSQLVSAVAVTGASGTIPAVATQYQFVAEAGVTAVVAGSDGVSAMTDNMLVGSDVLPREGMYALRGQNCGVIDLCDVTNYGTFTLQTAFGLGEGAYMMLQDPAGSALSSTGISTAISNLQAAGVDSYAGKMIFGDWVYWYDPTNQIIRLVSPQAFCAGKLVSLSPEQSSLNKPLVGIIGTQKSGQVGSGQAQTYSEADLSALSVGRFDVIANPQPGGAYWGMRIGHNCSSNASIWGDNYTRLTNFIALTLSAGMGKYVGATTNPKLFMKIAGTLNSFLSNLVDEEILAQIQAGSSSSTLSNPYTVVCDESNNPFNQTKLGYVQADVAVQYQAINEKFIVNLEGGQTVKITTSTNFS